MMLGVRLFSSDEPTEISAEIVRLCSGMPRSPDRYLLDLEKCTLVPTDRIVLSRIRPDGVKSAIELMRNAAEGRGEKRAPIEARRVGPDYQIEDGNSTTVVLIAIGLTAIPVFERAPPAGKP